jgi:hypothetical protein
MDAEAERELVEKLRAKFGPQEAAAEEAPAPAKAKAPRRFRPRAEAPRRFRPRAGVDEVVMVAACSLSPAQAARRKCGECNKPGVRWVAGYADKGMMKQTGSAFICDACHTRYILAHAKQLARGRYIQAANGPNRAQRRAGGAVVIRPARFGR